jgi:ABC-type transport system involved in multi-copper enzyme maturation permease subunit
MTFFSLLLKEFRVRMRRERTTWIILSYVLLMGLLGWFFVSRSTISLGDSSSGLSDTGVILYTLLAQTQLFLLLIITPALTASTINGEKERQTYDMLLCSQLSSFSLVAAKLLAGLLNALLLIAAAIPLFSLVFFFGGISLSQFFHGLLVLVMTSLTVGTFALLCSTLFPRPSISTTVAYVVSLIWVFLPLVALSIINTTSDLSNSPVQLSPTLPAWLQGSGLIMTGAGQNATLIQTPNILIWNPVIALFSTYSPGASLAPNVIHGWHLALWQSYALICLMASILFFLLSIWLAKPNPLCRLPRLRRKEAEPVAATA